MNRFVMAAVALGLGGHIAAVGAAAPAAAERPNIVWLTTEDNSACWYRLYNKKGQECITVSGELCRCGRSSKKPFCDNKHGCAG